MEIALDILKITVFVISLIYSIYQVIKNFVNKNYDALKKRLKENIIPLMEQAENFLDDPNEKTNWVIKKLGDRLHIDFYSHKKVLKMAIEIIAQICEDTKIEVNKTIEIIKDKEVENDDPVELY